MERARRLAVRLGELARAILGVPDYERYLAHMAVHHPGCAVMTRAEFARERLEARYSRPGAKCC